MPIRCPRCRKEHDVAEFPLEHKFRCSCGEELSLSLIETIQDFERYLESEEEKKKAVEIQQQASWICRMILDEHCPGIDIELAKAKLRERVSKLFPDKMTVYEMIYEARFRRLWDQFRKS